VGRLTNLLLLFSGLHQALARSNLVADAEGTAAAASAQRTLHNAMLAVERYIYPKELLDECGEPFRASDYAVSKLLVRRSADVPAHGQSTHDAVLILMELYERMRRSQSAEDRKALVGRLGQAVQDLGLEVERYQRGLQDTTVPSTAPCPELAPEEKPKGQKATINMRIKERLSSNPLSVDWPQTEWANVLGCSASAVAQSQAWKTIMLARAQERARRRK
jgi:hypothetical protein